MTPVTAVPMPFSMTMPAAVTLALYLFLMAMIPASTPMAYALHFRLMTPRAQAKTMPPVILETRNNRVTTATSGKVSTALIVTMMPVVTRAVDL